MHNQPCRLTTASLLVVIQEDSFRNKQPVGFIVESYKYSALEWKSLHTREIHTMSSAMRSAIKDIVSSESALVAKTMKSPVNTIQ
jgi:hypothetical protein